jgi:hypothetical protein
MIKFFRNIRQKLAVENKAASYFRYAVGEIKGVKPDDDVTFVVIKIK